MDRSQAVRALGDECRDDYVGLWQVARALPDGVSPADRPGMIVSMVSALLHAGPIKLGQFHDGRFQPWLGTQDAQLERLRCELKRLGRDPDIGEIAWLTEM